MDGPIVARFGFDTGTGFEVLLGRFLTVFEGPDVPRSSPDRAEGLVCGVLSTFEVAENIWSRNDAVMSPCNASPSCALECEGDKGISRLRKTPARRVKSKSWNARKMSSFVLNDGIDGSPGLKPGNCDMTGGQYKSSVIWCGG